jgi:UDP-glucose 4-epimerase
LKSILVTGGAGFIGSHIVVKLLEGGNHVVVLDNFSNSSPKIIDKIYEILDMQEIPNENLVSHEGSVNDKIFLDELFLKHDFNCVIHLAGLKAVEQSVSDPLRYHHNNVSGAITLLEAMKNANVFSFVFSSSATVYGDTKEMPISEEAELGEITNPYGRSKLIIENILTDLAKSDERWSIAILRYFNPVGAHKSGKIGEMPNGTPSNLFPYIANVAVGKQDFLFVHGNDYPTVDGSGVRDYIHILDLANGHLAALTWVKNNTGIDVWNLGTGIAYSVFEVLDEFHRVLGKKIPFKVGSRRSGDVAECWANPEKARKDLYWSACLGLDEMVKDAWRWQTNDLDDFD